MWLIPSSNLEHKCSQKVPYGDFLFLCYSRRKILHMKKQTIVVTGSTGGIGTAFTLQMLSEGHELYLPVRSIQKAQDLFGTFPNAHCATVEIESHDSMVNYFKNLSTEGVLPEQVVLLVGDLRKDSDPMFPGETQEEKETHSIEYHERVNVRTAETVVFGLKEIFGEKLQEDTVLLGVSSWAAHFEPGHPYRKDEEGYVQAKAKLSSLLAQWREEKVFKEVICDEPSLIVTPLTEREFPELIADPAVEKLTPGQYVEHLRKVLSL